MLRYAASPEAKAALEARLREPSLMDHFYDFLEHQGVAIPPALRDKAASSGNQPDESIQRALLGLYKTRPELAILFESMTDLDEGFQEWKYRHVKLVGLHVKNLELYRRIFGVNSKRVVPLFRICGRSATSYDGAANRPWSTRGLSGYR
jgi:hypothetical protein